MEGSEGEGLLAGWLGCRPKTPVRCGKARSANTCRCGCCFFFFFAVTDGKVKKKKKTSAEIECYPTSDRNARRAALNRFFSRARSSNFSSQWRGCMYVRITYYRCSIDKNWTWRFYQIRFGSRLKWSSQAKPRPRKAQVQTQTQRQKCSQSVSHCQSDGFSRLRTNCFAASFFGGGKRLYRGIQMTP